ncbi:uncharacterized protein BP01DRAFT_305439 [Aspergillus saccharolyticus JOP 1030-1]|uniref:Ricin B lectin domain-containing protein n=1 Tax=Aspergillus saccharolyticus JOP 1030-1 TaxID=1450539 RepID=A0A318Z3F6_9EURO|nr:hypothetical protein BP01DRAFT_305439 [Aspergillus saccharolyticus JOP 1030-1]PYH41606.1 hypothetical protein BP01DRAFT_305439 [Aspergillus saccharolyticus JOP 1030-1]
MNPSCPCAGGKYLIRDMQSKLFIALNNGVLGLHTLPTDHPANYDLGPYWNCVEKNNMWFGLKNTVSGGFITSNNFGGCDAMDLNHEAKQSFCPRHQPDGGYVLLFRSGERLSPLSVVGMDKKKLEFKHGDKGASWEFIRVDSL